MGDPDTEIDLGEYVETVTAADLRERPVVLGRAVGMAAGGDWLFRELDLVIPAGGVVALLGPNGVGKSTLLHCLYGLTRPTEGDLTVFGEHPDERLAEYRHRVSVLLDDSALFDEFSPRQHLDLMLRSFPNGRYGPDDIEALLESCGLGHRVEVPAGDLSAGQRRRLLLIGALARPADLLLLDEPERALDVAGLDWLAGEIGARTAQGVAVVLATHSRTLVRDCGADVVALA